jgi:hypothetical protein
LNAAVDALREKFGTKAVSKARLLTLGKDDDREE